MKLIDVDALLATLLYKRPFDDDKGIGRPEFRAFVDGCVQLLDAAPSIDCAADNPHGLIPSKCPTCGEELVPYPCMDMAQDSYRDGILYGQQHPEWGIDG